MDQTFVPSRSTRPAQSTRPEPKQVVIDLIVGVAMGVVAIAVAVALNLHFGLPLSRAIVAGILIYALLVGAHFLLVPRRPPEPDVSELEDEELWRALKEQREAAPDAKRMAMATRTPIEESPTPVGKTLAGVLKAHVPRRKSRIVQSDQAPPVEQSAVAGVQEQAPAAPTPLQAAPDAGAPGPHQSEQGSEQNWSYRPGDDAPVAPSHMQRTDPMGAEPVEPTLHMKTAPQQPSPAEDPVAHVPAPTATDINDKAAKAPSESDVELVQSMIKKLAHQVNASEVLAKSQAAEPQQSGGDPSPDVETRRASVNADVPTTPEPQPVQPPPLPFAQEAAVPAPVATDEATPAQDMSAEQAARAPVDVVGASVDVLKTTAEALREADAAAPEGAPSVEQPLRPARHPDGAATAKELFAAMSAGHFGVLLDPILALNDLQAQHYEVRLQVNTTAGEQLEADSIETDLQATDALSAIDRQRFSSTMSVGDLLQARGKSGDVLTRMYRESLLDRDFCYAVATSGVAHEHLARRLVLTLSQEAVRSLTATEWQTLSEFHELGYRFAVSHVRDLDMDFSQLAGVGFSFIKLEAALLLNGGSETGGSIPPQELARYFAGVGLGLIVDGVADMSVAADLAACGVELGQGPVSGGPRLMKAEAISSVDHAVA